MDMSFLRYQSCMQTMSSYRTLNMQIYLLIVIHVGITHDDATNERLRLNKYEKGSIGDHPRTLLLWNLKKSHLNRKTDSRS